jgi:hypothetical protein
MPAPRRNAPWPRKARLDSALRPREARVLRAARKSCVRIARRRTKVALPVLSGRLTVPMDRPPSSSMPPPLQATEH